jgi:nonsense-mediated mRNA decay protein 3
MDTAMTRHNLPEVILVKKSYKKKPRSRRWKLKRLPVEEDVGEDDEYEAFLSDLEQNPELRFNINLYKNGDYRPEIESTIGDDAPTVPIEELFEDLTLGYDDEEDTDGAVEGNTHVGMVE